MRGGRKKEAPPLDQIMTDPTLRAAGETMLKKQADAFSHVFINPSSQDFDSLNPSLLNKLNRKMRVKDEIDDQQEAFLKAASRWRKNEERGLVPVSELTKRDKKRAKTPVWYPEQAQDIQPD